MKLQHGFIGTKEVSSAREILADWAINSDKNIYIQRMAGYGGNLVKGQWFKEIEELSEYYVSEYLTLEDYNEEMLNEDEDYLYDSERVDYTNEILDLLEDGKIAYTISDGANEYIGDDKGNLIIESITDGDVKIYTYQDAVSNLDSEYVDENLVIWLLK